MTDRRKLLQRGKFLKVAIVALLFILSYIGGSPLKFSLGSDSRKGATDSPITTGEKATLTLKDFMGSEACADCHHDEYQFWKNSTHGRAGGKPNPEIVIGTFDGTPLYFKDAVVTPSINKKQEYIFTVEQNGFPKKIFKVDAVIGGGFMEGGGTQSYFSEFPDGTLKMLPFDFIRKENIWFIQLRDGNTWIPINREISLDELFHWPPFRILGTEATFSNCQNCHGSQIQVNYDSQKKRYVTEYKSLTIDCESCHGPGRRHIELAKSNRIQGSVDIGMKSLSILDKDESLKICFRCHAIKDVVKDGYLPGKNLEHYFSLKLPILGNNPYLPDGRIRSFAYQQNHLFSDCYLNGSMVCVDCHSPHSLEYRDIFGNSLEGKFDNGQCTACHAGMAKSPELHSHHLSNSLGNRCTSCHMPFLQHQGIGNHLRFARADHTISIPRPAFDERIGVENACKQCHKEKTVPWLEARTEEWYGELKPHNEGVASLIQAQSVTDRQTASKLLLYRTRKHTMAQVTGLIMFTRRFLDPDMNFLEVDIIEGLKTLSESSDIDLKALALMSLHFCCGRDSTIRSFLDRKLEKMGEEEVPVRTRWAIAVDDLGILYAMKSEFNKAIAAHSKAVEIRSDDRLAWVHLGNAHMNKRELSKAAYSYEKALEIKPDDASIQFKLGRVYALQGNIQKAIKSLEEGLKYDPNNQSARRILRRLRSSRIWDFEE